jgi:exoribonuclease R
VPDDGSKKAFIPTSSLNGAAKGDKVMAKVVPGTENISPFYTTPITIIHFFENRFWCVDKQVLSMAILLVK